MGDGVSVEAAAAAWIAAWNAHDLDAIMEHYADDVVFRADTVVSRWNRPDGTLRGTGELREHFRRGLDGACGYRPTMQAVKRSV